MPSKDLKAWIKEVFANVVENMNPVESTYSKYFSEDYVQYVDGKTLTYEDFVAHMKAQKAVMRSVTITFKQIVVEGNRIATIHYAEGIKKDGSEIKAQVNAVFEVENGKIISCDELTRLIKGDKSDKDLGSRY